MKLTNQQEKEIMQVYNSYWDNYIKGDVEAMQLLLDEEYTQVGSAEGEVFLNKKDAVQFLYDTIDQVAGKLEMRNRSTTLEQQGELILIHERCALYAMADAGWIFYSKFRASTLLKEKKEGWKITHQHSSFPDTRAEDGENIAINKIAAENFQLREAVKRRTIELEQKNRDIEIESALERVRAQAMSMRAPDDLPGICEVLFSVLHTLGFDEIRNAMINIHDDNKGTFINYDYSDEIGKSINHLFYNIHPVIEKQIKHTRSSGDAFSETSFTGKDLDDWKAFRKKIGEQDDPRIETADALYYYFYSIGTGSIGISTFHSITEEKKNVLKRFRNVFDFAYRRYMDVALAEEQAREAQIELGLERVRARAMAMQHSDELARLVTVVFKELTQLDFVLTSCIIWINNPELLTNTLWVTSSQMDQPAQPILLTPFQHPFFKSIIYGWKAKDPQWIFTLTGDEKQSFEEAFFKGEPGLPAALRSALTVPAKVVFSASFNNFGALEILGTEPLTDEKFDILHRFGKVFDSSYTRFNDLKNAEAQAREAQIELGLERVRAKAMATQNSEELNEIVAILFEELTKLDLVLARCIIWIFDADTQASRLWMANSEDRRSAESFYIKPLDHPYYKAILEGWKQRELKWCYELKGPEKKSIDLLLLNETELSHLSLAVKAGILNAEHASISGSFGNFGMIEASGPNALSTDQAEILARFTKEFERAYTRFLDLQKAEAQVRESQIQLALERVRARTMAMQKSGELPEAANLLFQQMQALGMPAWSAGYCIWDKDKLGITLWMSSEGVMQPSFHAPLTEDPSFINFLEAYKKGKTFFVNEIGGEALVKHYQYMRTLPVVGEILDSIINEGHPLPTFQIFHCAYFSQGFLLFITYEPVLEAHDIFKRFGKVFDQTYTRFLDLQKAEAQAREAQIETALERVRSRSMGMQKSEELKEVIKIVYQQLTHLKIKLDHAGFVVDYTPGGDWHFWIADEQDIPAKISHPYFESVWANQFNEAKEKAANIFATHLNFEEKNKFYNELLSYVPGLPQASKDFYLNCPGLAASTVLFDNVSLYIENFSGTPYTDEENTTLKRFGKVFQQTYTRFLDLQRAEAQAREAKIEAALERVRSRTMAMQHSDELAETSSLLFKQIDELGVKTYTSGFQIWQADNISTTSWMAQPNGGIQAPFRLPHTEDAFFKEIYGAKQRGEDFFVFESEGKSLEETYAYMNTLLGVKEALNDYVNLGFSIPKYQLTHCAFFDHGYLMFITLEQHPEMWDIFKRFAKVFEQTYTRFLDLQRAEAQAREAKIEAALERTRTQSMIMQHSNELDDTLRVFHEQVLLPGIPSAFSFLWLPDEKNDRHIFWAAWKENDSTIFKSKAINYPLDRNEPATAQCLVDWKSNEPVYSYHVPPADVENYFAVWQELIDGVDHLKPEYFSGGLHYVEAFMKYGCFGVMVANDLTKDEKKILGRFAIEFERTYRRFLDLQKAEAQAREAQIEAALERVRGKTMAMHISTELQNVIMEVASQLEYLGFKFDSVNIDVNLEIEKDPNMHLWISVSGKQPYPTKIVIPYFDHPIFIKAYERLNKGEKFFVDAFSREEKDTFFDYVFQHTILKYIPEERKQYIYNGKGMARSVAIAKHTALAIYNYDVNPYAVEQNSILVRFSYVFDQAYTRFLDLQKAEAQAKESQVQLALERVRARTMAMQHSNELQEAASVMFQQLIMLGIEPNRLYIAIVKDAQGHSEFWITEEDGTKVSTAFSADLNKNKSFLKMLEGWKQQQKSLVIDIQGEELQNYFRHLTSLGVPFKGGLEQKRRVQDIAYFSKGFIGMASPDEQPAETLLLLERFAAVFNLTFTRFNDLKITEAHALQAAQDLIAIKEARQKAEDALTELQATQKQLIQSEKMASLGELTAGIAHEIQNPLNFVNNFSEVNKELIEEMQQEIDKGNYADVKEISNDIKDNEKKINHHGKRADAIVKGMLQHSQTSTGKKEPMDINKLADEYLRLAYHGLRAKDKAFNATLKTDYDETIGKINIIPQDIGRVILNVITNAFYAVNEKKNASAGLPAGQAGSAGQPYEPTVSLTTKKIGDTIEILIGDNGNGIPQKVVDKIFQPFFTTKPTGQGTGLGLSLAYDIVKVHGGEIKVETKEGEGTIFSIILSL